MKKPDDKGQDLFGNIKSETGPVRSSPDVNRLKTAKFIENNSKEKSVADSASNGMDPLGKITSSYIQELKRRTSESRAYKSYQLTGLEIANILEDWEHKSLYMRLAKVHGESKMMQLAKNVVERKNIENKGAYFMSVLKSEKDLKKKSK